MAVDEADEVEVRREWSMENQVKGCLSLSRVTSVGIGII
jgi:hypothetical protein